jgi:ABC-2 type transport system ATP-binding protein
MEYVVGQELLAEIIQELNRLPELGELVEFGCGTGSYTETIVPKTKSMFATDLSDSPLAPQFIVNIARSSIFLLH